MLKKLRIVLAREQLGIFKYLYNRFSIKKKIITLVFLPISLPITLFLLSISPWIKIRLFMLFSNRIGHYAWNTEFWLCVIDKEEYTGKRIKNIFYTVPGHPICNKQLHIMWKRIITIIPLSYLTAEVDKLLIKFSKNYRNNPLKKFFSPGMGSWDAWDLIGKSSKPHIDFTKAEHKKGEKLLQNLNIPVNAKYVCLLGRDDLYMKKHMPWMDTSQDDYRNVDINNYKKAALFLASKGYFIIRMGKFVKQPFEANHPNIIDYANSHYRSDFADIYLSANCYFFISVATGLDAIPHIFKRPILQTNVPTFDGYLVPQWLFFITKKVKNLKNNSILKAREVAEIFSYDKTNKGRLMPQILEKLNLRFIENSAEEIEEVVKEMEARLTGKWYPTEEDELLQNYYWSYFKDSKVASLSITPPNIAEPLLKVPVFEGLNREFNKKITNFSLRLGTDFLKKNQDWLLPEDFNVEMKQKTYV